MPMRIGPVFLFMTLARFGVHAFMNHCPMSRCTIRHGLERSALDGGRASAAIPQTNEFKDGYQEKLDLQPPRGTRDFYPEDMRVRAWLFGEWRYVAKAHGFSEYDAPVLESEALYIRKAGEEVTQQLYNFEDKGGRRVTLRPEMTPSLARMVMARRASLPLPIKWFSIPQCWRYERMTRGRRREHFQWNMDILGSSGAEAEAELLSAIILFFTRVGLTSQDVGIKVNSRALLQALLGTLGVVPDAFASVCVLVDKLEKVPLDSLKEDFKALGIEGAGLDKLVASLKAPDLSSLAAQLPSDSPALQQLKRLFSLTEAAGLGDWLVFDASVVRGLAYYTGTVFEAFDRSGNFRAIAGGGRYDSLLTTFGATEQLAACGFGLGDAVIIELLQAKGLLPNFSSEAGVQVVVAALEKEDLEGAAGLTAWQLREGGIAVDLVLGAKKLKWVFKHAQRLGATTLVLIASEEWGGPQGPTVIVKDLVSGEQATWPLQGLATKLSQDWTAFRTYPTAV